jgi:hypothetical protein
MIDFKGSQFEKEIIMWGVRWYVAYPINSSTSGRAGGLFMNRPRRSRSYLNNLS